MKTQAKWEEDGRKEKMMFEDYKLSQEALVHNAKFPSAFLGGQRLSLCLHFLF